MSTYHINPLDTANYTTWSTDIRFLLLEKNCYDIVVGNEKLPEIGKDGAGKREVDEFNIRQKLALSIIYLNISENYRPVIENIADPATAWTVLRQNFRPDNRSYHMQLYNQLLSCRCQQNEQVTLFSSRLMQLAEQIKASGKPMEEVYLCYQLLRNLPQKFDSIIQAILRWNDEDFLYKKILLELVAEESRLNFRESECPKPEIFHIKGSSKRCYECGKLGHLQRECRYLKPPGYWESPKYRQQGRSQSPSYRHRGESPTSSRFGRNSSSERSMERGRQPRSRYQASNRRGNKNRYHASSEGKNRVTGNIAPIFLAEANLSGKIDNNCWIFDTAASNHFCNDKNLFVYIEPVDNENMLLAVNDISFPIEGKGDVKVCLDNTECHLKNVLYSPNLRRNLISGPMLDKYGFKFVGQNGVINVYDRDIVMFKAKLERGLYYVSPSVDVNVNQIENNRSDNRGHEELMAWHEKFGHANIDYIVKTSQLNAVGGLPRLKKIPNFECEPCKLNKYKRVSFKTSEFNNSKAPLELLFLDVWGPAQTIGRNGERYYVSILDDFSKRMFVFPISHKSDVFDVFIRHVKWAERSLGRKVKKIRTDNGGEFINQFFEQFCGEKGIRHQKTNIYTPQQNGSAERLNQTVLNGARTILDQSKLDRRFWPDAILCFVYVWNRLCHTDQTKTPIELYTGYRPTVRHFHSFGSTVFVGVPKPLRGKLDPKAKKGILIGYSIETKGYKIWIPDEHKVIQSSDVVFSKFQQNSSGAVLAPVHPDYPSVSQDEDEMLVPEPEVPVHDLNERDTSSASEDESEEEESGDSEGLRETSWRRTAIPRSDGSRTDVYYYESGKGKRLRSINEVEKYCQEQNLVFHRENFDFSGKNHFEGEVTQSPIASGIQTKRVDKNES